MRCSLHGLCTSSQYGRGRRAREAKQCRDRRVKLTVSVTAAIACEFTISALVPCDRHERLFFSESIRPGCHICGSHLGRKLGHSQTQRELALHNLERTALLSKCPPLAYGGQHHAPAEASEPRHTSSNRSRCMHWLPTSSVVPSVGQGAACATHSFRRGRDAHPHPSSRRVARCMA
jgi:hypothetical protein